MTSPRPFSFDTVFDETGVVVVAAPPRPKRVFTADEVEQLREAAYREGEASAVARAQEHQALALAQIAEAARAGLSTLAQVAHGHQAACAELALVCAGKIADAALTCFPTSALEAALEALGQEIETAPRLLVRMAEPGPEARAAVEAAAQAAGFPGQVQFRPEPGFPAGAFAFEWGDGRAAFDPTDAAARVGEALVAALAAEGDHPIPHGAA